MPSLTPDQAQSLISRSADILEEAARLTSGADPNYIRDAMPESIFESLPLAAARQGCRRYADKGGNYPARRAVRVERACRSYLDSIGYGTPPTIKRPFEGGTCPEQYTVSYEIRGRISSQFNCGVFGEWGTATTLIPTGPVFGPISGFQSINVPDSQFPGQTNRAQSYVITAANGQFFLNLDGASGRRYWFECGLAYEYRNLKFTKLAGGTDECAPVTPDITPPVPPPTPGPPIERFNPSPDVDVDIGVEVNIDGSITVNIGAGPITIDPFDEDEGGDGGGGSPPPPGDVGEPGAPSDTGAGGDSDGEAPPGQVLTGVRVDILEMPAGAREYAPGVFRAVCYVYMGTNEGLDHDPAGAMMRSGQFVLAEKDNLTKWRVESNSGYNLRVTPYYREVEA